MQPILYLEPLSKTASNHNKSGKPPDLKKIKNLFLDFWKVNFDRTKNNSTDGYAIEPQHDDKGLDLWSVANPIVLGCDLKMIIDYPR